MASVDDGAGQDLAGLLAEIDTSRPSIARSYDAVLGGTNNYAIDREVRDQLNVVAPGVGLLARDNRAFLIRATRFLAGEAGIGQFLDCGSGLPTVENTHDAVGRVDPSARVVYVDNDPVVAAHGRALLAGNETARFVSADLTEPEALWANPEVRAGVDLDEPLALYQVGTLHHVLDDADPRAIMENYLDLLPTGSYVVISHFVNPGDDDPELADLAARLEAAFLQSPMGTGRFRSRAEIATYFGGLDLIDPGLVALNDWRPEELASADVEPVRRLMVGAIARKT